MMHSRLSLALAAGIAALAMPALAFAEPVKVVASFSILADMARQIGGEEVEVTALVGPDGDAHVFQPSPADTRKLADADVVIVNGLAFEGWMPRLVEASGFAGKVVTATQGIEPLAPAGGDEHDHDRHDDHEHEHGHDHDHDHEQGHEQGHDGHHHGAQDPHAWQSLANGVVYARNIAAGLAAADPANAGVYAARGEAYAAQLTALDAEVKAMLAAVPEDRRKIVTSHDAFGYFAAAYDVTFIAPEGVSTEAEASAADVAAIIGQIRDENISAIFVESISDPRLVEQIGRETDAKVGGALYSDALSPEDGPAPTYLDMFRFNVRQIVEALKTS